MVFVLVCRTIGENIKTPKNIFFFSFHPISESFLIKQYRKSRGSLFQTKLANHNISAVLESLCGVTFDVSYVFRYEIGEGLYIGWSSATMALCGGSCLLSCCGLHCPEDKKWVVFTHALLK